MPVKRWALGSPVTGSATFQPRFTLSLLYLGVLFLAYALLLIAPELAEVARPAGPEEQALLEQQARETARRVVAPRLPIALVLAIGIVNYIYKFLMAIILTPVIYLAHYLIDSYLGKEVAHQLADDATKKSQSFF